jgi:hypothetical protein
MNEKKQKALFIALVDSNLRIIPRERVTLQVLRYIKLNKNELVAYIQHLKKAFTTINTGGNCNTNIAVKVRNLVLDSDVYFIVHGAVTDLQVCDRLITYLPCEIEYLIKWRLTPEEMKKIGMVKKMFPGSMIVWN